MPMKAHENLLVFYKKLPTYNPQKTEGHAPVNSYTKYLATQNKTELYNKATKELSGGGNTDRYPRSVIKAKSDKQKNYLHSTQKPLDLCSYFIKTYSNEGDVVLDNASGSGTTGEAAMLNNRHFILIDNDKTNYEKSLKRVSQ
jgi:site-specific DNA-methyltransferase (adenine-specific)